MGVGGVPPPGGAYSSGSNLGIGSLLSPTSPTYPAPSPLTSNSGLPTTPGSAGLPTISSLANGLPTLSPNGLGSSPTDPLHSPLHRYVCRERGWYIRYYAVYFLC